MELDQLFHWIKLIYNIFGCIALLLNLFLSYCILKKSPPTIGIYKRFLLNMAISDLCVTIHAEFLYQPITLPNGGLVFVALGPIKNLGGGSRSAIVEHIILVLLVQRVGSAIVASFACRYCLFSSSDVLQRFLSWRALAAAVLLELSFAVLVVAASISLNIADYNVFVAQIMAVYPAILEIEPNFVAYGNVAGQMAPQTMLLAAIIASIIAFLYIASLVSAFKTIRNLNAFRESMSLASFRFHRLLTIAIVFQLLLPVAIMIGPLILSYCMNFFLANGQQMLGKSVIKLVVVALTAAYPSASALSTIYFVAPYRKAITAYFYCKCNEHSRQRKLTALFSRRTTLY